jgi:hypothetical protein
LTRSRRYPDPLVCRKRAAECEQWAERVTDTLAKQTFHWLNLAALVEAQEKSEWCNAAIPNRMKDAVTETMWYGSWRCFR